MNGYEQFAATCGCIGLTIILGWGIWGTIIFVVDQFELWRIMVRKELHEQFIKGWKAAEGVTN